MGRAPCCVRSEVKRGPWSPEEDTVLRDFIAKNGTGGSWISLPKKAGLNRCGKSCRLRWMNYLRPDIKHGCYSAEEDCLIVRLYFEIGSRWSIIASQLPGRTDNDVKNYWNTKLKKKLMVAGGAAAFQTPATVPVNAAAASMDYLPVVDLIPQAYPEVGPDHWFYQLSNDQFAASSSATSSVAKSHASWSDNVEEMESKSSVYDFAADDLSWFRA